MTLDIAPTTARHLPLDGGGWEGVSVSPDPSCPAAPLPNPPRKGEGAASHSWLAPTFTSPFGGEVGAQSRVRGPSS